MARRSSATSSGKKQRRYRRPERSEGPEGTTNESVAAAGSFAALRMTAFGLHALPPELLAGKRGALGQRLELGPGDVGVDPATQPAVARGDDTLAADQAGETADALGHQLGMLDDVGGMAHHAGQDQLVVWQLGLLPHRPLVLVAHIARFEGIG